MIGVYDFIEYMNKTYKCERHKKSINIVYWGEVKMKANEGEEFHFRDGSKATSAEELLDAVKGLAPSEVSEHLNENKNDFYEWLKNCVDEEAAENVREARDHRTLVEKLAGYQWELEHREKFGY